MKSSNRFLIIFAIVISVLVVLTVVAVLATRNNVTTLPESAPEGVVQRFLQAVQEGDYLTAFGYMRVVENNRELTYPEWAPSTYRQPGLTQSTWRAAFVKTSISGNTANVEVIVDTFRPQGPFQDPVDTQTVQFTLTKISGTWYITTRPPIYWIY